MWTFLSAVAGRWRGFSPRLQGFLLGLALGLMLLIGTCVFLLRIGRTKDVEIENVRASLDSTRVVVKGKDSVYARLLFQQRVSFPPQMGFAADERKPVATFGVKSTSRGIDTTARHVVRGADQSGPKGSAGNGIPTGAIVGARVEQAPGNVAGPSTDSLVLKGPPVSGTVSVTVDSTQFLWHANLTPTPVDLALALTCSKKGPELLAHGPSFIHLTIDSGAVDPKVCHPASRITLLRGVVRGAKLGAMATGAVFIVAKVLKVFHVF